VGVFVWVGWVPALRLWRFASAVLVAGAISWSAIVSYATLGVRAPYPVLVPLFAGVGLGLVAGWKSGTLDAQSIGVHRRSGRQVVRTWRDPHPAFVCALVAAFALAIIFGLLRLPEITVACISYLTAEIGAGAVSRLTRLRRLEAQLGPIEVGRGIAGAPESGFVYRIRPQEP